MTIQFLLDKICLEHNAGLGHPEQPLRIKSIIKYFESNGLMDLVSSKDSVAEEQLKKLLHQVHENQLIERVKLSETQKETYYDQDTQANDKTYQAALKAGSLAVSASVKTTVEKSYFSIMRPPGHHATARRIMGFCFFNNIALAAQNILDKHKKVAIVDFDFHYGNGTADLFATNPNVLYISMHADPSVNFPNQGFIDEIGSKEGKGYNICLPFTFKARNNELLASFHQFVLPLLYEFKPDIVGMSAGFDGYYNDPVGAGYLQYDHTGFNNIGTIMHKYSNESKVPIFHVLEGGYNIQALPELVHSYAKPWLHNQSINEKSDIKEPVDIKSREKKTFEYLKQMLKPYWNLA